MAKEWRECVRLLESYEVQGRFTFPGRSVGGPNCAEGLTYTDITGAIGWAITIPGDAILRIPLLSNFFEFNSPAIGHSFSLVFGWGIAFIIFLALLSNDTF